MLEGNEFVMKKQFCILLFVLTLFAGCIGAGEYLEDYPPEPILELPSEETITEDIPAEDSYIDEVLPILQHELVQPFIQEISPFGRRVAAEFLGDFWSLFGFSLNWFCVETDSFFRKCIDTWSWLEVEGTQLFYWGGVYVQRDTWSFVDYNGRIFDSNGNEIEEVPFIRENDGGWFPNVAHSFSLIDFTGTGIPEIIITFLPITPIWEACLQGVLGETIVYSFVDGAYREIGALPHRIHDFFVNSYGEFIAHSNDGMDGYYGYYLLRFDDGELITENIFTPENEHMGAWWEHHGYNNFHRNPNPTMFPTGTPLARISPLRDLSLEIREQLSNDLTVVHGNVQEDENTPMYTEFNTEIQALEDFLFPLLTIFDLGHSRDSGALISYVIGDEYGNYTGWINRYGESIEPPNFLRGCCAPSSFRLYDFDNDGIPELFINYHPLAHGGGGAVLYRFKDGEYRRTALSIAPGGYFFTDSAGRIVFFDSNWYSGEIAYFYFTLHDEKGAELEMISQFDFSSETGHSEWYEHHRYPYWYNNPTIFRMPEETLTPIPRLIELEEQITANIRRRHGLS